MAEPIDVALPVSEFAQIAADVVAEAVRSSIKHGDQAHLPDGTGPDTYPLGLHRDLRADELLSPDENAHYLARLATLDTKAHSQNEGGDGSVTWWLILREEVLEAAAESDRDKLRAELIQVAAVAMKWAEAIDRRADAVGPSPDLATPQRL